MTEIMLWVLISLGNSYAPYTKVEQFTSKEECLAFRQTIIDIDTNLAYGAYRPRLVCIGMRVSGKDVE